MSTANQSRLNYFLMLTEEERKRAIHRLAASGMNEHGIATATQCSVEQIRAILCQGMQCENRE
jgi:uncharacterized protein YoaH (UPF0181 family)